MLRWTLRNASLAPYLGVAAHVLIARLHDDFGAWGPATGRAGTERNRAFKA